jgi:hypothetical protein
MATVKWSHDLGFMIMPWAKRAWELERDGRAFETMKSAAKTLYDRYGHTVGGTRSWDFCTTKRYSFITPDTEFLTVIVSPSAFSCHGSTALLPILRLILSKEKRSGDGTNNKPLLHVGQHEEP